MRNKSAFLQRKMTRKLVSAWAQYWRKNIYPLRLCNCWPAFSTVWVLNLHYLYQEIQAGKLTKLCLWVLGKNKHKYSLHRNITNTKPTRILWMKSCWHEHTIQTTLYEQQLAVKITEFLISNREFKTKRNKRESKPWRRNEKL